MAESESTTVLLVDDHQVVRQGLRYFLSKQAGIEVVGEAETGEEGVRLAAELEPDVVLMDLILPTMSGHEAIQLIRARQPEVEILVLTSFLDDDNVSSAFKSGATGYLMKDVTPAELARGIRVAARGEVYLHPEAARRLAQHVSMTGEEVNGPLPDVLTEREIEVLKLVTCGLSNRSIALELEISPKTVKVHVSSILAKLQLESRVQAAIYALRYKIIGLEDI